MTRPDDYRFGHVHIFCTELAETERWFLDGIGAELVARRDSLGIPVTDLRLGGARIALRGARQGERLAPPGPSRFGIDHIGLEVVDLDATAAELKRRGVLFELEPCDFGPGSRIAYVRGPDNVRVEFVERAAPARG